MPPGDPPVALAGGGRTATAPVRRAARAGMASGGVGRFGSESPTGGLTTSAARLTARAYPLAGCPVADPACCSRYAPGLIPYAVRKARLK